MEKLQLICGGTVLTKGKKGRDTVCIILADENCDDFNVLMNKVVQMNLRVWFADVVTVTGCGDVPYGNASVSFPLTVLLRVWQVICTVDLASYFLEAYGPVMKDDLFLVRIAMHSVEFKVVKADPAPYCIVAPDMVIHCKGETVKREDEEKLSM